MSIAARIRTGKRPTPNEVFDALVERGAAIIITSPEYPCIKFGNYCTALRCVEVNEADNGIEVRVCSCGFIDDYKLFAKTIDAVMNITGGSAFYGDDDDDEIFDPIKRIDDA